MRDNHEPRQRPRRTPAKKLDPWDATKAALQRDLANSAEREGWGKLRARGSLDRFERPQDVLGFLADRETASAAKNEVLTALVEAAQARVEIGRTLLYLALWPGLSAIRARWLRTYRAHSAELAADIGSLFMIGVDRLDMSLPRRVAATLCRNTERELARARFRREREVPLASEGLVPDPRGGGTELLELCEWVARETGHDAELILRVLLHGEPASEVASELGLTPAAAWQRVHRLSMRLRRALRDLEAGNEAA